MKSPMKSPSPPRKGTASLLAAAPVCCPCFASAVAKFRAATRAQKVVSVTTLLFYPMLLTGCMMLGMAAGAVATDDFTANYQVWVDLSSDSFGWAPTVESFLVFLGLCKISGTLALCGCMDATLQRVGAGKLGGKILGPKHMLATRVVELVANGCWLVFLSGAVYTHHATGETLVAPAAYLSLALLRLVCMFKV